ncbi:DUF7524 family protein [Halobellus sp. GM3]|uniref:DUF7524 family protein n=1 Tax=Halobellus sp. GM3 TaxID=3458410 RepID=UPI00403DECCC
MSESLRVELNGAAVHAIDAPEEFASRGPFHVELHNAGGDAHVHLRLGDDLSRVAQIDGGNHYVEGGAVRRVPVGTVTRERPVTGDLEIVTGYGAETARVAVTVVPDAKSASTTTPGANATEPNARTSESNARASEPGPRTADENGRERPVGDAERPQGSDATVGATATSGGDRSASGGTRSASVRSEPTSGETETTSGGAGRASADRSTGAAASREDGRIEPPVTGLLPRLFSLVESPSREELSFLALAAVALVVGLGVMVAVTEFALRLVIVAVVAAVLSTAGWILLR